MKKFLIMFLCVVLSICTLCSCTPAKVDDPAATEEPEPTATPEPEKNYGLHVEEDGTITLNGEPYYAFGTNWHGGFQRLLENPDLDYTAYFEALQAGLPVIRTMMNVFYDKDEWICAYDLERVFYSMDKYVAYCEKYHIGLIMSMMWCQNNFYVINGESVAECMGDPEAKGTKMMQEYVRAIVSRYKDSPAIYAWEVGNEGNLAADRGEASSIQTGAYYKIFAETVREIDKYRLITTGDSMVFECTNALRTTGKWSPNDTFEQKVETIQIYNQDPINCIEDHFYGHQNSSESNYQRVELVPEDMEIAKSLKKGYIVGEFGAGYEEWATLSNSEMETNWISIVDDLVNDGVQIALQWDFGRCAELNDEWSIELGFISGKYQNEYQYNKLKAVNEQFVADGKNKSAEYWENAVPLIYGTVGNTLEPTKKNYSKNEADLLKDISVLEIANFEGTMKTISGKAYTSRTMVNTTLSDGSEGLAFRIKVVGEGDGTANMPNRFVLGKLISCKNNTTYTAKITLKATNGEGHDSCNGGKLVIVANKNDNAIDIICDNEWHTYIYTFDVGTVKPTITIGADNAKTGVYVGAQIIVEGIEVYEAPA